MKFQNVKDKMMIQKISKEDKTGHKRFQESEWLGGLHGNKESVSETAHEWSLPKPASKGTKQVEKSWGVDLREASREIQPRHRSVGSEEEVCRRMFQSREINMGRGHEVGQVWLKQLKRLMVAGAPKTTTEGPTSIAPTTAATTTTGLSVMEGNRSSASLPLSVGAAVGAGAVLIIVILGLILYLRWKRSKGLQTAARTVARGSLQNTEEKYENIGIKRQQTDPKLDPKDEAQDNGGILYASLTLSSTSSPAAHPTLPKKSPQEETLYSILKA
ncbi:paired immunoglobulin-like type 2 receptor alpha [Vulpes lagopus]|uniref:paired immunoglobulin-like type 2 receptor alpha n=1 Tax=Vulpes lagopus TaxID=494514 RepID=UPI001BC95778|nr:paired immunoglobulin-like type 2 receptor alpha [Vulpes lagopus]